MYSVCIACVWISDDWNDIWSLKWSPDDGIMFHRLAIRSLLRRPRYVQNTYIIHRSSFNLTSAVGVCTILYYTMQAIQSGPAAGPSSSLPPPPPASPAVSLYLLAVIVNCFALSLKRSYYKIWLSVLYLYASFLFHVHDTAMIFCNECFHLFLFRRLQLLLLLLLLLLPLLSSQQLTRFAYNRSIIYWRYYNIVCMVVVDISIVSSSSTMRCLNDYCVWM
jgi:hypothetical protein